MKILLKYILIALFCISTIKNACPGSTVSESACIADSTCKWTQTVPESCSGDNDCWTQESSEDCLAANVLCSWVENSGCTGENAACTGKGSAEACSEANVACSLAEATGTCTAKTYADYKTDSTCN